MDDLICLDNKREMFWDDYLVETELTTAKRQLQQPIFRETVFWLDQPVENSSISYPCILRDPDGYRLYYGAWHKDSQNRSCGTICVLVSKDGKNWERPALGIHEFAGSRNNNIGFSGQCLFLLRYKPGLLAAGAIQVPCGWLACRTGADGTGDEARALVLQLCRRLSLEPARAGQRLRSV